MKRKGTIVISILMAIVFTFCFTSCDNSEGKEFVIQYSDDVGSHQLTVIGGMPYSLDVIPSRDGYEFTGLYDAAEGGTQYVSANGASIEPFTAGKNLVLFPQFKAKEYTVILDYQGAAVTGERQFKVNYGANLPELPKNLTGEHKEFCGWYTKPNCEGTQVADQYGLLPVVSVLNSTNFDLKGEYVNLYAGFQAEMLTVTCHFGNGVDSEQVKVEYGTPVSKIVTKTRIEGFAPLTWSKTEDGELFNGQVESNMTLYAVEYAPVIDFDSNGGSSVASIVARESSAITLPTPTKDLAKFAYWEDMLGNKVDEMSVKMPSVSVSLKAVWQGKLVFDSNGGSDVDDISVKAGEKITLPTPEKEGFIFAGWYTAEKDQYTSTTMPTAGVALKAGWYKENKTDTKILLNETDKVQLSDKNFRSTSKTYNINLEDIIAGYTTGIIRIKLHFQYMNEDNVGYYDVTFSSSKDISSATLYWEEKLYANGNTNYQTIEREVAFETTSSALYLKFRPLPYGGGVYTTMKDLYFTIYYPDTTNLYL